MSEENCVFAFPHVNVGWAQTVQLSPSQDGNGEKVVKEFKCHNTALHAMKLSQNGEILATASNKGTLVRLFNALTGEQLSEVRRGADQAVITDLSIDPTNMYITAASDKGTIHIFKIHDDKQSGVENKKSSLSAFSKVVGYFGSKWSFSQFRVKDSQAKCAIVDNKIIAITT